MPLFIILLFVCFLLPESSIARQSKMIYGYIEKVTLVEQQLTLPAKLDTGAASASLNAKKIHCIVKNGKPHLSFVVPSKTGEIPFTCEYLGEVNIKMRAHEVQPNPPPDSAIKRPVVLMRIKLGEKERVIRVNLTNRNHFSYPLLLGREAIIAFNGIIDPGARYNISPLSKEKP